MMVALCRSTTLQLPCTLDRWCCHHRVAASYLNHAIWCWGPDWYIGITKSSMPAISHTSKFMIYMMERQYTGPILIFHMIGLTSNTLLGYTNEGWCTCDTVSELLLLGVLFVRPPVAKMGVDVVLRPSITAHRLDHLTLRYVMTRPLLCDHVTICMIMMH